VHTEQSMNEVSSSQTPKTIAIEDLLKRFQPNLADQEIEEAKSGVEQVILTRDDNGRCMDIYCTSEAIAETIQRILPHYIDGYRILFMLRDDTLTEGIET